MSKKDITSMYIIRMLQVFMVMLFVCYTVLKPISNLDEIWVFNYGLNVSKGSIPYRDINLVTTPFSVHLLGTILAVFGKELYVYRFLSVLIYSVVYIWISRDIGIKIFSQILLSICFGFLLPVMNYEYNILNNLFIMCIIKLEENNNHDVLNRFICGLVIGLVFITKQSTGLVLLTAGVLICIVCKEKRKEIVFKIVGFFVPVICLTVYLLIYGVMAEAVDYMFFGLWNFAGNFHPDILYASVFGYGIVMVPLFVSAAVLYIKQFIDFWKRKELNSEEEHRFTAFLYAAASISILYPLFDYFHLILGVMPIMRYLIPWIGKAMKTLYLKVIYTTAAMLLIIIIASLPPTQKQESIELTHFKGIALLEGYEENFDTIINTIKKYNEQGKEVYILDMTAGCYFIPLDIWHKDYDMLAQGNTGIKDACSLISMLERSGNVVFVRKDFDNANYQTVHGLSDALLESRFEITGECLGFNIMEITE